MDIYLASNIAYSRRNIGVQDKILMFPIKKVDLLILLLAGAFFLRHRREQWIRRTAPWNHGWTGRRNPV